MSDVRPMTDEETRMMQTIISLRLENNELKDKAEREAVELVALRAENERLAKEVNHWREARRTALLAGDVLKAENERLQAYIIKMVEKAADQKLDGYRELGARCAQLEEQIDALRAENERLARARAVVDEQAEDEGLWCPAATATEAYLQYQLRRLHAAVEGER